MWHFTLLPSKIISHDSPTGILESKIISLVSLPLLWNPYLSNNDNKLPKLHWNYTILSLDILIPLAYKYTSISPTEFPLLLLWTLGSHTYEIQDLTTIPTKTLNIIGDMGNSFITLYVAINYHPNHTPLLGTIWFISQYTFRISNNQQHINWYINNS